MTFFALVRHGQTAWNFDRRIQGLTDIPLNETGLADARRAADTLRGERFDAVITSPLLRAQQTAEVIASELLLPAPVIAPTLHERAFGEAEGILVEEFLDRYGDWHAEVPGAESFDEVRERALAALDEIARRARARTAPRAPRLIVVTHGGLIRSLVHHASKGTIPAHGSRLLNGSVHRFVADNAGVHLLASDLGQSEELIGV
ncbi:histidine phosphatase family protein [Microbacterium keratanolyticum]|uniref:histidine phosphatase family protein n=1 Tax=Microbacterium keratanolyticum TaxID=67574 RepID=UPI0036425FF8